MRAGLLRDTITILKPVKSDTAYGKGKVQYEQMYNTRAQVTHVGGNKAVENAEVITSYTVKFTIRMYHAITSDMVIQHLDKRYRILDINPLLSQQQKVIIGEVINE